MLDLGNDDPQLDSHLMSGLGYRSIAEVVVAAGHAENAVGRLLPNLGRV